MAGCSLQAINGRCLGRIKKRIIESIIKNHSEKVYFFGVIFLCAILPYFKGFASIFFEFFIQGAQKFYDSQKVYLLRISIIYNQNNFVE